MNRDKIRDLASRDLKIKTAKFDYIFESDDLQKKADEIWKSNFICFFL